MDEMERLKKENTALKHKMEQLLAENEELKIDQWRLNNLLEDENTPNPWDLDCITNVFKWSPQFRKLLNFKSQAEFPDVAESWINRLHPDDRQRTLDEFERHIGDKTGKYPYDVYYQILPNGYDHGQKDAKYMWVHAKGVTLRDGEGGKTGNAIRVYGTAVDVTEKIRERGYETEHTMSIEGIRINFEAVSKKSLSVAWYEVQKEIIQQCTTQRKNQETTKKIANKFYEVLKKRLLGANSIQLAEIDAQLQALDAEHLTSRIISMAVLGDSYAMDQVRLHDSKAAPLREQRKVLAD